MSPKKEYYGAYGHTESKPTFAPLAYYRGDTQNLRGHMGS